MPSNGREALKYKAEKAMAGGPEEYVPPPGSQDPAQDHRGGDL